MSNSNVDLQREAYFKDGGKKFHRDRYGLWFINDKFWESIKIKDISDAEFRQSIESEVTAALYDNENAANTKTKIDDETFTIWLQKNKNGGYEDSNVSRKSAISDEDSPLFEEGADIEEFKKQLAEKKKTSTGGGGSGYTKDGKKITLYRDFQKMTLDEFNEANKKDWKRVISPKNDPNTFIVAKGGIDQVVVITAEMYWKDE